MRIKTKLLSGMSLLAIVPILVAALTIGYGAINSSEQALEGQLQNQLISIRDATATNIENYFGTLKSQMITFSGSTSAILAVDNMSRSFNRHRMYLKKAASEDQQRAALTRFYNEEFYQKYNQINETQLQSGADYVDQLSTYSLAIQFAYLSENPNGLGEKLKLDRSKYGSTYDGAHSHHHPGFRKFLNEFGLYDIFLIENETGNVVYSVYKEIDFATSLIDGPFADSGLGDAFRMAKGATDRDAVFVTDAKPYAPSYEASAFFMSTPIFDADDKPFGTLVFQIPEDRINDVMTHYAKWETVGLGKTGETYLVGPDLTLRSETRHLIQDQQEHLTFLKANSLESEQTIAKIRQQSSAIGLQKIASEGAEAAISGATDFGSYANYRNDRVLSAYKPLNIEGLNWAIISEITHAEAFSSISELKQSIVVLAAIAIAISLGLSIFFGGFLASSIIRPINKTVDLLKDIAQGEGDLNQRLDRKEQDELGELSHWFDLFVEKLQKMFIAINNSVATLVDSSGELEGASEKTKTRIVNQHNEIQQAASAITEMSASAQETLGNVQSAADKAQSTLEASKGGEKIIESSKTAIDSLAGEVDQASGVVTKLSDDSKAITEVLVVIENIAEQTNLLALNAAIEAARAGESGRGFAVVADEVRSLAQRTQESTKQIQDIISRLQTGSHNAVNAINRSKLGSDSAVEIAGSAQATFNEINQAIDDMCAINTQIASTSEEQSKTIEEIDRNIHNISTLSTDTNQDAEAIANASYRLSELASQIKTELAAYKV